MPKHTIVLIRDNGMEGFMSNQTLGTDALNAMSTMPGVENLEIVNETDDRVTLSYEWIGKEKFWHAGDHLRRYGVAWENTNHHSEQGVS